MRSGCEDRPLVVLQYLKPGRDVACMVSPRLGRIMAEAILNRFAGDRFRAYSAGSDPAKAPMPEVLEKLRSVGHDVSGLHSKSWNLFTGPDALQLDFVIGICDVVDRRTCPDFGDKAVTASWSMPDPAKFTGQGVEREAMLNELYGGLYRRITIFANLSFAKLDRMAVRKRLDEIGAGPVGALMQAAED
jgi:protein-tyrosine-phosphatase